MINKQRTLGNAARYLGMKSAADGGELLVRAMDEVERLATPRSIFKRVKVRREGSAILAEGLPPIESDMLGALFEGAHEGLLALITLGADIDMKVRALMVSNPALGASVNACAGAYVDALLDEALKEYSSKLQAEGRALTGRVSPGYGDLPLGLQKPLLGLLQAGKVGVSLTTGFIMLPEKSVTAIAAIVDADARGRLGRGCDGAESCGECPRFGECPYKG